MDQIPVVYLSRGAHTNRSGTCLMEAASVAAGMPFSDRLECASTAINHLAIVLNDFASDELRQELLVPFIWRVIGTRSEEHERTRLYMLADWCVRFVAPIALDAGGLKEEAQQLRDMPQILSRESALEAARAAKVPLWAAADSWSITWAVWCAARIASLAAQPTASTSLAFLAVTAESASLACAATQEAILRSGVELLDRMIGLTEIREKGVQETESRGARRGKEDALFPASMTRSRVHSKHTVGVFLTGRRNET